jgi:hypothetical protein
VIPWPSEKGETVKRFLCCSLLIFTACASLLAEDAGRGPHRHPVIVSRVRILDSNSTVPLTILFTPKETGLYRITAYMTILSSTIQPTSWGAAFVWTDSSKHFESTQLIVGLGNNPPFQETVFTFIAKGGTPVEYLVDTSTPAPQDSTYTLFFTVEQL